mmetsp:Transcript_83149/g.144497  ORF Transcript_83149/g.144497 Transcript_83149/m.144497 type:complete len:458 (-) Transcript_83149:36-1409(-)
MVELGAADTATSNRKVVIDAGAAIKLQRLERFGGQLFTTGGVIREIRDENARALLKTLPDEIRVRECLPQDLAFVKQFAKATGDLGFLSQNDMELIGLTVGLNREAGGHVRERPARPITDTGSAAAFDWAPAPAPKEPESKSIASMSSAVATSGKINLHYEARRLKISYGSEVSTVSTGTAPAVVADDAVSSMCEESAGTQDVAEEAAETTAADDTEVSAVASTVTPAAEQASAEDGSDNDSDGSSAGEWVTPDNMHRFGLGVKPAVELRVTCATADYSVQNVLLQMGITPLTFDGFAVRTVKLWGLVCRACFHFTRDTTKVFCPKCGHDTCVRVPIIVDQDGQAKVLNNGRPLRKKGTVYSIPKAQGGRGWQPIFSEDQMKIGGRDRELRHLQNVSMKERTLQDPFNEDNAARAWYQRSTTGTGRAVGRNAPRVQAGYGRVNPNANNHKFKGRKKR